MKILFYYEISHYADGVAEGLSYELLKTHLSDFFAKSLLAGDVHDVRALVSSGAVEANKSGHALDILKPIGIDGKDYLTISPVCSTYRALYQKIFFSELSAEEIVKFNEIIKNKLRNWEPELIIAFPIHNDYLKQLYPHALFLSTENGIFSRAPFPRTIRFEPFHYIQNFTNRFSAEIQNQSITDEMDRTVQSFRDKIVKIVERHNPFSRRLKMLRKKFQKLVLLPVIWGKNIYRESYNDDEISFLLSVLKKIPPEIGVISTVHEGRDNLLTHEVLAAIKLKYPNLITENDFGKRTHGSSPSLYFFNHVDAVINCMTGTGLQASIWPTRIIALDKQYSHWFSDSIGIDDIETQLSTPIPNRNAKLYWYMTHCVVWESHFNDPVWLNGYFDRLAMNWRNGKIDFEFFPQCEDFETVAHYTLDYMKRDYRRSFVFDVMPAPIMLLASNIKARMRTLIGK